MECCLPTCAHRSSVPVMGNLGFGGFWTFMFLFGALCLLGVSAFLGDPLLCKRFGSLWCASCWTRPLGVLQWEDITFVTSGEQTWQPIIQPRIFLIFLFQV